MTSGSDCATGRRHRIRLQHRWTRASVYFGAAALVLASWVGCGDDETTKPPEEFAPPTNLTYVNDDGSIFLDWDATPDENGGHFAGYLVYRDSATMAGLTDAQLATKKITSSPVQVTSYTDDVQNGVKYFYAVRAIATDDHISEATNEINTAARVENDQIVLAEFAFSAQPSGVNLGTGTAYAMRSNNPDNRAFIELYLGTDDDNDAQSAALALKSPSLVSDSDPDWANRSSKLKLLTDWDDPTTDSNPQTWQDKVILGRDPLDVVGKVVAIRTPADGQGHYHYAKLEIQAANLSTAGQRTVTMRVAYQSIPDYIRFRPHP